jgi:hypothetical protein
LEESLSSEVFITHFLTCTSIPTVIAPSSTRQSSSDSAYTSLNSTLCYLLLASIMSPQQVEQEVDYKLELAAFGQRLKARREAGL